MNEIEELLKQHSPSSNSTFKNIDGTPKNSLPPTPLSALFNFIGNELNDSTDKNQSKMSIFEVDNQKRSSSSNNLIKKKEEKDIKQLKRADTDITVLAESDRKVDCIPESKQRKKKDFFDSPSLNSTFQSITDNNENDDGALLLSVRQPSFSNLTAGHLIVKGIDENEPQLDAVEEEVNPVVVLTKQTEPDQLPITLQVREASKPHFDIQESLFDNDNNNQGNSNTNDIFDSIFQKNAERLRKMGYNPNEKVQQKKEDQNIINTIETNIKLMKDNSTYRNPSNASFSSQNSESKKIKRVTSAGNEFKEPDKNIFAINEDNESGYEEEYFDSSKNFYKESPRDEMDQINVNNFNGSGSSEKVKNQSKKNASKKFTNQSKKIKGGGWKANSFTNSQLTSSSINNEYAEHEFGTDDDQQIKPPPIDLKMAKTQQYLNNSELNSAMPKRLEALIFNEFHHVIHEESVAYLALCGSDIIGYKETRIIEAMFSLRLLLKRCIDLGYITESAYVQGIIEKTIQRQNEFKKFNRVNPSKIIQENLTNAKTKKEVKEKTWNARISAANSEYEIAVNDMKRRYEEEKNMLDKKWHSKSSILKYRKPSSSLNQMKFVAKKMLDTHRFEEAASLSKSIEESEKNEAAEAAKRMNNDYKSALAVLEKKYKNEAVALKTQFEARKLTLVKKEKTEMMPIERQVKKFAEKKEQLKESRKRNPENSKLTVYGGCKSSLSKSSKLAPNLTINSSLKLNLKAALPPSALSSAKRRTQSRLSRPTSYHQDRSSDLSQIFS